MSRKKLFSLVSLLIIIVGIIVFISNRPMDLTVTNIHDNVIYGQTTTRDLKKLFGKPDKVNSNKKAVIATFEYENGDVSDGGLSDMLDEYTDFSKTEKIDESALKKKALSDHRGRQYDCYVEYQSKKLGVNYIRFFISDGVVYTYQFGHQINDSVAKKDKYLKQLY